MFPSETSIVSLSYHANAFREKGIAVTPDVHVSRAGCLTMRRVLRGHGTV